MKIEKIVLEDEKIKGTNITPKKVGETQEIRVDTRINGFFGGAVNLLPTRFESAIQDRLDTLKMTNKKYLEVNSFSKARRNSKKYSSLGTFNTWYNTFIDFYKI